MTAPQPDRHALLSPSSAYKWMKCNGSIALEQAVGAEDKAGPSASAGTFMHHVAAKALTEHKNAVDYLGYKEVVDGIEFTFDPEHAALVQVYLDTVWTYVGLDGVLFVEQALDISFLTGEADAIGTADAIVIRGDELIVIDLKTGRNGVKALCNNQLVIYSMAALKAYQEGKLTAPVTPAAVENTPPPVDDGDDLC